jgi:hypothetical protein
VEESNAGTKVMQSPDPKPSIFSMTELAIELSADKLSADNATLGKVTLRASDVDSLIAKLAYFRAGMTPEIPRVSSDPGNLGRVLDPLWILHAPLLAKDKLLLVRHPGLGWMMFQLPPSEAAKLGHALLSDGPRRVTDERLPSSRFH